MKESVNEFIVYNTFVTGPSSTKRTFFMETRNALLAVFISPESNYNTGHLTVHYYYIQIHR